MNVVLYTEESLPIYNPIRSYVCSIIKNAVMNDDPKPIRSLHWCMYWCTTRGLNPESLAHKTNALTNYASGA
jgi:hypothetical protein